jgi:hypothetical protein
MQTFIADPGACLNGCLRYGCVRLQPSVGGRAVRLLLDLTNYDYSISMKHASNHRVITMTLVKGKHNIRL